MAISDFSDMAPSTVSHAEFSSRDAYGAKTYGSSVDYSARIVYKSMLVRDKNGNEVVAKGTVWIIGTPNIDTEDELTLPDGSTPPILDVSRPEDEDGVHHTKVIFG